MKLRQNEEISSALARQKQCEEILNILRNYMFIVVKSEPGNLSTYDEIEIDLVNTPKNRENFVKIENWLRNGI